MTRKQAYDKGWTASSRTRTFDLDAAQDRFVRSHGTDQLDGFLAGWTDYAADYPKGESL